jgi:hypothetical protein
MWFTEDDLFLNRHVAQMDNKEKDIRKEDSVEEDTQVMHTFMDKNKSSSKMKFLVALLIVALAGVITGFGLSQFSSKTGTNLVPQALNPNAPKKGKIFGSGDEKTFKDTAEGVVKEGGVEGEGQYHLERTGGESQNVYMTSSLVDLSQFVGKKVKVWGQTQAAQKAGWLMDVGKVQVL